MAAPATPTASAAASHSARGSTRTASPERPITPSHATMHIGHFGIRAASTAKSTPPTAPRAQPLPDSPGP